MATATKTRTEYLSMRLAPELKRAIESRSAEMGMTMAAYIAHLTQLDQLINNRILEIKS